MKRTLTMLALCAALCLPSFQTKADVTFNVDPAANWLGFMNVFELPDHPTNPGGYLFGSPWGTADLVATFGGSTLTLSPNTIGDPNEFWYKDPTMSGNPSPGGPGAPGNKTMDANFYVEAAPGALAGETITFEGNVLSNTLTSAHVARAFIRDFAPDYSSFFESSVVLTPGPFSVNLLTDLGPDRHVQYGFNFNGVNVWITDVGPYGTVQIAAPSTGGGPGDFDNDMDVDGDDLAEWKTAFGNTAEGDADDDGDSDGNDFLIWQQNLGSLPVAAVPEPAVATLLAAGLAWLAAGWRRRIF